MNWAIGTDCPATADYPLKTAENMQLWGISAAPRVLTKMGAAAKSELYLDERGLATEPHNEDMSECGEHLETKDQVINLPVSGLYIKTHLYMVRYIAFSESILHIRVEGAFGV
jgi:hypothetical protein